MTRNGTSFPLPPLVPPTDANASGSWPTPTASLGDKAGLVTPSKGREGGTLVEAVSARLWPTPTRSDGGGGPGNSGRSGGPNLRTAVKMWPTPTTRDHKDAATPYLRDGVVQTDTLGRVLRLENPTGGGLNPTWVEWLMGFPLGWTDCEHLATPSFRRSLKSSADSSSDT